MVGYVSGDRRWQSQGDMLRATARAWPDRIAIVDGPLRLTYRDFEKEVREIAKGMIAAGVEHGSAVAIWAPNCVHWLSLACAAVTVGAALVPLNTRFKSVEAEYILSASRAELLFYATDFLGIDFAELLEKADVPALRQRIAIASGPERSAALAAFVARGADVSDAALDARLDAVSHDDIADIMFTSGTTGLPKGVMISHGQNLKGFYDEALGLRMSADDVFLITNPLFHAFGYKTCALGCLMTGATVVPVRTLDVNEVFRLIEDEKITVMAGPPTMYLAVMDHAGFASLNVDSVRAAVVGSTSVPAPLFERIRASFGLEGITSGYGLTESSGVATFFDLDATSEQLSTSAGPALPGVELRIAAPGSSAELPRGEEGEILIRGYCVMKGYLNEPELTREAIDADGWLHTGDVGRLDADGNLVVTDRLKDMFVVGGFNAYPAEIEQILLRNRAVGQVAVIGVPDDYYGEVGHAFVIRGKGADIDEAGLIAWARDQMANFKVPRGITFVDAFPLTVTGKIRKADLRSGFVAP